MWVSGSLIRSSTWRSSSVSAPCISSSICLSEFAREVAHDARQLLPGVADRLHARLHDAFLQFGGDVGEPLQRHLELGVLVAAGDLQQLVAGQHQLGDHRHQVFERVDIDADRLVGDLVGFLNLGLGDRLAGGRLVLATGFASLVLARLLGAGAELQRLARAAAASAAFAEGRSSSSSDTSPGRSGRSSVCGPACPASRSRGRRAPVRPATLRPDATAAPVSAASACPAWPRLSRLRRDRLAPTPPSAAIAAMPRSTIACSSPIRS